MRVQILNGFDSSERMKKKGIIIKKKNVKQTNKHTVRLVSSSFSVSLEEVLSRQAYSSDTGNSSGHIPEYKTKTKAKKEK